MNIKQKVVTLALVILAGIGAGLPLVSNANADCGGAKTSIINCTQGKDAKTAKDSGVWGLLLVVLNIMTAGIGILAVGGVVYAAILYSSSSDNAEQTKKAKDVIRNVAIGIIAYGGMYLALNFLIPGGIFS